MKNERNNDNIELWDEYHLEMSKDERKRFMESITIQEIIEYLKRSEDVSIFDDISCEKIKIIVNELSDRDKIKIISKIEIEDLEDLDNELLKILQYSIRDDYYKSLVIKIIANGKEFDYEVRLSEYDIEKKKVNTIQEEEEKANYIATLEENDMKLAFLNSIKKKENRDIIIQSLTRNVVQILEPQVNLANIMIREFFQDCEIDEKKKELLEICLNRTHVTFNKRRAEYEIGNADVFEDSINVSAQWANFMTMVGTLIHEYAHILSSAVLKRTLGEPSRTIDEGIADLFVELVINHYIQKHGNIIELDGRKIKVESPFENRSAYYMESSLVKTVIYPLEEEKKDREAISEYLLGDKKEFMRATFGEEVVNSASVDVVGNTIWKGLRIGKKQLYESNADKWTNVNRR